MTKHNKKGQMGLASLYPAVLAIIIIGIALGIGIYVLNQTGLATSTTAFTVTGENVTVASNLATVATADDCGFQTFALLTVANGSGSSINLNNFTTSASDGTISNASGVGLGFGVQAWRVNYTYVGAQTGSSYCSTISTTSTGLGGLASWIAVIVVVLAAAIVLGIVMRSFGTKQAI
jgi:hypothetical protein